MKKHRYISAALAVASCAVISAGATSFADVSPNDWFCDAVDYGVSNGFLTGSSDGTFSPNSAMTRAQFISSLGRMEDVAERGSCHFRDVADSDSCSPYVAWATENGLVAGTSADTFSPDATITREQMATIIDRYLDWKHVVLSCDSSTPVFSDADQISDYAVDSIALLRECGLLSGDDFGNVNPQEQIKRAEAAAVFMRLCVAVPSCETAPSKPQNTKPIDENTEQHRPELKPETESPNMDSDTQTQNNETPEDTTDAVSSDFYAEVLRLVNVERAAYGLPSLTTSDGLQAAANVRAAELPSSFSHNRPNGSSCFTALSEAGISYSRAGENIAWGQRTPEAVVKAWMNSPGHRENILSSNFKQLGVGYTQVNGTNYWSQLFIG